MKQYIICDSLVQILYISKLNKKEYEKNAGDQGETVSSGKDFYILLRLAITH